MGTLLAVPSGCGGAQNWRHERPAGFGPSSWQRDPWKL